jgi:hypothetical protein
VTPLFLLALIIDSVYHQESTQMRSTSKKKLNRRKAIEERSRDLSRDAAIRELLDHIARELATEYLRLIKEPVKVPHEHKE